LKKLLKKFVLNKHNKAKNQINTFTKNIECPQLLKQQLFFIEEKNNAYKMSRYLLPSKKGPKISTYPKNSQVVVTKPWMVVDPF
jgi:hypothetical protein